MVQQLESSSSDVAQLPTKVQDILKKCKKPNETINEREKLILFDFLNAGDKSKREATNQSEDEDDCMLDTHGSFYKSTVYSIFECLFNYGFIPMSEPNLRDAEYQQA